MLLPRCSYMVHTSAAAFPAVQRFGLYFFQALRTATTNVGKVQESSLETQKDSKWDLLVGLCIERPPRMSRQLSPLESSIKELFSTLEIQKSKKSDHEMQKERDTRLTPEAIAAEQELKLDNLRTPGTPAIKAKADDKVSTAQDREDQWQDEFNEFTLPPVPVRPGYDDSRLYLLVQNNDNWRLPHEPWRKDDRSLRDTAERLLTDIVEPNDVPRILILGNAPFGFHKFKYPTTSAEGALGAKVFFYKARVSPLSCDKPQTLLDSPAPLFPRLKIPGKTTAWVTKKQLEDKVKGYSYRKDLSRMLLDDD